MSSVSCQLGRRHDPSLEALCKVRDLRSSPKPLCNLPNGSCLPKVAVSSTAFSSLPQAIFKTWNPFYAINQAQVPLTS